MKKYVLLITMAAILSSCNGWTIQPLPNNPPTPFLPSTLTPSIFTATPVIIVATSTPNIATASISTSTPIPTATTLETSTSVLLSNTPPVTFTEAPLTRSISVEILGCNTSVDVTHGMGEVTNAFVTLKNTGNVDLTNLATTLAALDEGREHPDKTVETALLQAGYEVTLKMTVDSTYREETPVQVEVTDNAGLFQRVGAVSCQDIGLFAPDPASLNTPVPAQ